MSNYENIDFETFIRYINSKTFHDKIMYLSIYVDSNDNKLKELYKEYANEHNRKIFYEPHFYDAGFDLFLPENENNSIIFVNEKINKIDFKIKCCAKISTIIDNKFTKFYYTPFYTYCRSSISKTPLRLANNQGIIDAGYRGNIIGMFDCLSEKNYKVDSYSKILQICSPNLLPIYVKIVDNIEDLGPSTSRGEGGFGSTGK